MYVTNSIHYILYVQNKNGPHNDCTPTRSHEAAEYICVYVKSELDE